MMWFASCKFLLSFWCSSFSSRARHTMSLCDWSSDVCSSDLAHVGVLLLEPLVDRLVVPHPDDSGEVLALGLGDAEVLVGLLHVRRDLVPAVVAAGRRRGVEIGRAHV